jgi:hypothetical protein
VRLDDAVGRRVREAGERVPGADLVVVQERPVHAALQDLAGAARVGKLQARLQDVAARANPAWITPVPNFKNRRYRGSLRP